MRVLVTGGAGYIGSVMCRALVDSGHDVLVLDNLAQGHRQAITGLGLVTADLQDLARVVEACKRFKPEGCMHFAARNLVGESMQVPLEYFENNVGGTINLLRALVESGCRWMVFSSSAATYGNPADGSHIDEDAPRIPVNPYGKAKLMVEEVLGELDRVGDLRYVSLRYFNAAGADTDHDLGEDHSPETHLIPNVLKVPLGQTRQCEIFGTDYSTSDGTCIRDYIHIKDLAQAHMLGLQPGKTGFYNLGNGDGYSVRQVIQMCEKVTGKKIPAIEKPRRPGDPPKLVASAEKAMRELGWKPKFPKLEDIVATAWAWHKKHPDGYLD